MSLQIDLVLRVAFLLIIGVGAGIIILLRDLTWNLLFTVTEYVLRLIVSGCHLLFKICFTETRKQTSSTVSSPVYQYDIFGEFKMSKTSQSYTDFFAEQILWIFSLETAIFICTVAVILWILLSHNRDMPAPSRPHDQRLSRKSQPLHSSQLQTSRLQADLSRVTRERSRRPSARQLRNIATEKHSTDTLMSDIEVLRTQLFQANEELSLERDKSLCIVCMDAKREVLLKPCNHYCLCSGCSKGLRECPMCKKKKRKAEKIFHA